MNPAPAAAVAGTPARRLARHASTNIVYGLAVNGCAAVAAGILYRALGADFGILTLVMSTALTLNLLDDSLGAYLITTVSERLRATDCPTERERPCGELGVAVVGYVASGLIFAAILAAALAILLSGRGDVLVIAGLAAVNLFLFSLASIPAKVLEGHEEYARLRTAQGGIALVRLAGVAVLSFLGCSDLTDYLSWLVGTYLLLGIVLSVLASRRSKVEFFGSLIVITRGHVRRFGRFVRPLFLAKVSSVVSYRLDLWLVQGIAGAQATAAYALATNLAQLVNQSLEVVKGVALPVSVRSWRHDDADANRTFLLRASKLSLFLVGGACVTCWAALESVLDIWFGDSPSTAVIAARLLLLFAALTAFRSVAQTVVAGQRLFHHLERHFLVAALLNFVISLVATYHLGPWGAALGTALAGVYLLMANLTAIEAALGLGDGTLASVLVAPGLAALTAAAAAAAWFPLDGSALFVLVARGSTAGFLFVALFWALVLDGSERRWITARVCFRTTKSPGGVP